VKSIADDTILKDFDFKEYLDELLNLRNNLVHLTPLTIYLTYKIPNNGKSNFGARLKVIELILNKNRGSGHNKYHENFNEIKNTVKKFREIKKLTD
jgi:hypothetical protein